MPLVIRPASNSDIPGIVDVIRSVFDEYSFTWEEDGYHADLYDIEAHYSDKGHTFFVAELDGKVIGTVAIERFERLGGENGSLEFTDGFIRVCGCDCSLERLYVHPDARKCGAGGKLITQVVNTAKAEGRNARELWSDKRFVDAHR